MSIFIELKRRNVLRVAAAYIVVAWLLIQVAETLFPLFGFDDTPARIVVIVLAIGLIPAMVFAWAFELTPEGLKKEKDIDRAQSITGHTGKRLDRMIMVVLAVALGYFAFDKFVLSEQREAAQQQQQVAELEEAHLEGRTEALMESYGDQSIAVLAFDDMSPDGDQEYLSDGIAEELLNLLAKIPELRVISRSSAFSFKGKDVSIPIIGEQLKVAHVLEGSVRSFGQRIRITAQLIDSRTDTHLWSETYDREKGDIFATQDEIAAAVVSELKVKLLGGMPTTAEADPEAYRLLLEIKDLEKRSTFNEDLVQDLTGKVRQLLDRAPDYAPAWAKLGNLYSTQWGRYLINEFEAESNAKTLAHRAFDRALQLDPVLSDAYIGKARLGATESRLHETARHLQRAMELDPTNTSALDQASWLLTMLGRFDAVPSIHAYLEKRDPLNPWLFYRIAFDNGFAGRLDVFILNMRKIIMLDPERQNIKGFLATGLAYTGQYQKAVDMIGELDINLVTIPPLAYAYQQLGMEEKLQGLLESIPAENPPALLMARLHATLGNADEA
ncbi:MAG: hypothetical protein V3R81_13130, partial [Gammaproteobacteria bacterium]